jgi:DMSO reductase family type II enzyme chaperone
LTDIEIEAAYARSAIYKLLSLAISYPSEEVAQLLFSGVLFNELKFYLEKLPQTSNFLSQVDELMSLLRKLSSKPLEDLQACYTMLFDFGVPAPPCPLNESSYLTSPKENLLYELASLYESEDLEADISKEDPDSLMVLLEFMHHLAHKEITCAEKRLNSRSKDVREKEVNFLNEHLMVWLPKLLDCVGMHARETCHKFYMNLIYFIMDFIKYDLEHLKISLTLMEEHQ